MNQCISKLTPTRFRLWWQGVFSSAMTIDFEPLIEHFQLKGDFKLVHWQAKPFGLRRWGVYDGLTGTYTSSLWVEFDPAYRWEGRQVDERVVSTKPTAIVVGRRVEDD
ncbi:MAG: hypothetical protein AAGG51_22990 [Cyanobacteria bacterium P01_G01_bin.54]